MLGTSWHELAEAGTDPFGFGWHNITKFVGRGDWEIADNGNSLFMPDYEGPRGADGANVTLNGNGVVGPRDLLKLTVACCKMWLVQ